MHARVLEDLDVVPDGRLVGRLEEDAIELAIDRAELFPDRGIVLADDVGGVTVEFFQGPLRRQIL